MIFTAKFNTYTEANYFCRGAIFGNAGTAKEMVRGVALVGKTITFTSPAGSCTFTQPTNTEPGILQMGDIKSQLETAISGLKVDFLGPKLVFYLASGAAACALAAVNEGGRVPLGLPNNEAESGVLLSSPGGTKPAFVSFVTDTQAAYVTYDK